MTLCYDGQFAFGESQADIRAALLDYSEKNGYKATHFADAICSCGGKVFHLLLDDLYGAAVRVCTGCQSEHPIGDSQNYLAVANLDDCQCPCGEEAFEITAGVSLYEGSEDVRWLYVGCRCSACGLTACYGDWKNEYPNYHEFLGRI